MQRKAILLLLLATAHCADAQKKDPNYYKRKTSVQPRFDLGGQRSGIAIGKSKKAIPEPLPPAPQTVGDFHKVGSRLPDIRLVDAKGKVVATHESIRNDANLFVMMFNPTCEHCEDMTRSIEENITLFQRSNIVLMAAAGMGPYLEYFDKNTNYTKYPKLQVGVDSAKFIDRTFNYETLPQINIYDKDRILIKSFSGLEKIDSLKPYIQ